MRTRLLLALCVLSLPITLLAAPAELPRTGQSTCWNAAGALVACPGTGQDGAIQAGAIWPAPRFVANGDGTVTDRLTGLVWLQNANCFGVTSWAVALSGVNTLGNLSCGLNDGSAPGDWRLPNLRELESLFNAQQTYSDTWLKSQGFVDVLNKFYWSSTTSAFNPTEAWTVNFSGGAVYENAKNPSTYEGNLGVWAVRGGDPGPSVPVTLARTGQTGCWDGNGTPLADCTASGQDGEHQAGAAWPSPRFVANGDGTVTDQLTGLTWLQDANCTDTVGGIVKTSGKLTWPEALTWSNALASGSCGLSDGSAAGAWRLPNRRELHSLVDAQQPAMASWLAGQGFTRVLAHPYWSATSFGYNPATAWSVIMDVGSIGVIGKVGSNYVWPVRGGLTTVLAVTKAGTGSGSVTPDSGSLFWDGPTGTRSYPTETEVTLSAVAAAGSVFTGWSGACSGAGECQVVPTAYTSVTATFSKVAGVPPALTVPKSDADGTYPVQWSASKTKGVSYQLQEATDPAFTTNLRTAYKGKSTSTTISGRSPKKTYYYRVRAKKTGYANSDWRQAGSGCAVPGTSAVKPPVGITVPASDGDGTYPVSWGPSPTAGVRYLLEETTDSAFTQGVRTAYFGPELSSEMLGRSDDTTYYYRVRAVRPGLRDSGWRVGLNGCIVDDSP